MTTATDFRRAGKELVDFIADYLENVGDRDVAPNVAPGFLLNALPREAPEGAETWEDIMADVNRIVLPGTLHWSSPQFHSYYPAGNSYPSLLGDMLSGAIGVTGFTWLTSPSCTELEMVVTDWLGRMVALPEEFLFSGGKGGGGVIHSSASEANAFAVVCARERCIDKKTQGLSGKEKEEIRQSMRGKLVMYTSQQAHCSGVRAGLLAGVLVRALPVDENFSLRGSTLEEAIAEDLESGLVPLCLIVCRQFDMWLHVDAAYAGAAFICPEFRDRMLGIDLLDSFNFNPHKWLLVHFDCSVTWFRGPFDGVARVGSAMLDGDRDVFKDGDAGGATVEAGAGKWQIPDYRHWQMSFGRRFRSLKLWFVLRMYGQENLRQFIRKQVSLAKEFERLLISAGNGAFKIFTPVNMGLVCFVWKSNSRTEQLFRKINYRRKIHLTRCVIEETSVIRFVVCSRMTELTDIEFAIGEIMEASKIVEESSEAN